MATVSSAGNAFYDMYVSMSKETFPWPWEIILVELSKELGSIYEFVCDRMMGGEGILNHIST